MHALLLALHATLALAGTTSIPVPGVEAWEAPYADYEPPGSCEACAGPRSFAVLGGEPWFLLSDRLVSGGGRSLNLPSTGVDLAAGPEGLWVLCSEHLARLEEGELLLQEPRWEGGPLEVAGDGTVMSSEGIGGKPFADGWASPWGAGMRVLEDGRRWSVAWPGREPLALPGGNIVDARPVGTLPTGETVLALTDSRDGSAPTAVRFVAVGADIVRPLRDGDPNGSLDLQPRRFYAVDPVDGAVYTPVVIGEERLSLRRY